MENIKNAINIWSKGSGKCPEIRIGVGVLSKGYYDYKRGIVVELKTESELRRSIDFYAHRGTHGVTRLSEDLIMMKERGLGTGSIYFLKLFNALQNRSYRTGNLPL